jgi:hypothetical protein
MKTKMKQMNISDFIGKVIVCELKKIIEVGGFHYLGFLLVAVSIECLGAFFDKNPIEENGHSEDRFKKGLKLFPDKYKQYRNSGNRYYLYNQLRNGMIHQLRPLGRLELTHRNETNTNGYKHLQKIGEGDNEQLVLVIEDFYSDLKKACNALIKKAESGKSQKDLKKKFINVPDK